MNRFANCINNCTKDFFLISTKSSLFSRLFYSVKETTIYVEQILLNRLQDEQQLSINLIKIELSLACILPEIPSEMSECFKCFFYYSHQNMMFFLCYGSDGSFVMYYESHHNALPSTSPLRKVS